MVTAHLFPSFGLNGEFLSSVFNRILQVFEVFWWKVHCLSGLLEVVGRLILPFRQYVSCEYYRKLLSLMSHLCLKTSYVSVSRLQINVWCVKSFCSIYYCINMGQLDLSEQRISIQLTFHKILKPIYLLDYLYLHTENSFCHTCYN